MGCVKKELPIVGATEVVDVLVPGGEFLGVPAKIDTGAASSAIWASGVRIDAEGILHFCLFGEGSEFYTGEELDYENYKVGVVRSSNGQEELRYRVMMTLRIAGKKVRALVSLADRSKNIYPVLVGRRTLAGKFLVDANKGGAKPVFRQYVQGLNEEMQKDPVGFYQKYMKEN